MRSDGWWQLMTSRTARIRAERFEAVMSNHDAWERRTLADLRVAGFNFQSIEKAKQTLKAQRTLARMSSDDLLEFMAERVA
jgi:hypothetical protein